MKQVLNRFCRIDFGFAVFALLVAMLCIGGAVYQAQTGGDDQTVYAGGTAAVGALLMRARRARPGRVIWLDDITLDTDNKEYRYANGLPREFWYSRLWLEYEGRFTMPAANGPTAIQADAPHSILSLVTVSGTHLPRAKQETFVNLRGPELWARECHMRGALPYTSPATLSVTADATNDVRIILPVPFALDRMNKSASMATVLDAGNYNPLDFRCKIGDWKQLFSGGTVAPTVSAFGSATGSPRLRLFAEYVTDGPTKFAGFIPGRMFLTQTQEIVSGDIVNGKANAKLFDLTKGNYLRSLMLKVGTKAAVTSANECYATRDASIITNLRVNRGRDRAIRHVTDPHIMGEVNARNYGLATPDGYYVVDFAQSGSLNDCLATQGMQYGKGSDVELYLAGDIAAGANQAALLVEEELQHIPAEFFQRG